MKLKGNDEMKKTLALLLALVMVLTLTACGGSGDKAASGNETETYTVGICQLAPHPALDQATQGFKDALTEALGDAVTFDEQNAGGRGAVLKIKGV